MGIKYRKGYKYQLAEEFAIQTGIILGEDAKEIVTQWIELDPNGTLNILKGYAWDGPSGPTVDTSNFMRGSLVHDALYQLIRQSWLDIKWREQADKELKRICLEDGMSKIRAWYVYKSVRRFARKAALPENRKKILKAP